MLCIFKTTQILFFVPHKPQAHRVVGVLMSCRATVTPLLRYVLAHHSSGVSINEKDSDHLNEWQKKNLNFCNILPLG